MEKINKDQLAKVTNLFAGCLENTSSKKVSDAIRRLETYLANNEVSDPEVCNEALGHLRTFASVLSEISELNISKTETLNPTTPRQSKPIKKTYEDIMEEKLKLQQLWYDENVDKDYIDMKIKALYDYAGELVEKNIFREYKKDNNSLLSEIREKAENSKFIFDIRTSYVLGEKRGKKGGWFNWADAEAENGGYLNIEDLWPIASNLGYLISGRPIHTYSFKERNVLLRFKCMLELNIAYPEDNEFERLFDN